METYEIPTSALKGIVRVGKGVVSTDTPLPILKSMVAWSDGESAFFGATDLEKTMVAKYTGDNKYKRGKFSGCVDLKVLNDVMRSFSKESDNIEIAQNDENIAIIEKGQFNLKGESTSEYPTLITTDGEYKPHLGKKVAPEKKPKKFRLILEPSVIGEISQRVIPASSKQSLRPILTGVLMDIHEKLKTIKFVATDSYRLTEFLLEKDEYSVIDKFVPAIIPTSFFRSVEDVVKNFNIEQELEFEFRVVEVERFTDEKQKKKKELRVDYVTCTAFVDDSLSLSVSTRTIDGMYPDYSKVIPDRKDFKNMFVSFAHESDDLKKVISKAHIFAKDANNFMMVTAYNGDVYFDTKETSSGKYTLKSSPADYTADNSDTVGNVVALSTQYLKEAIAMFSSKEVCIDMFSPMHPIVMTDPELPENRMMHIVMPLRVDESDHEKMPHYTKAVLDYRGGLVSNLPEESDDA